MKKLISVKVRFVARICKEKEKKRPHNKRFSLVEEMKEMEEARTKKRERERERGTSKTKKIDPIKRKRTLKRTL